MGRSWSAAILAMVMGLIGIVLTVGGGYLLILGGSLYYLIAGLAMLGSAWLLFRGRLLGGWIYCALFVLTAIWGLAEARGNAWAMVPWLIAPFVLLVAVALVMPTLTADRNRWKWAGGGIGAGLIAVVAIFGLLALGSGSPAASRSSSTS